MSRHCAEASSPGKNSYTTQWDVTADPASPKFGVANLVASCCVFLGGGRGHTAVTRPCGREAE